MNENQEKKDFRIDFKKQDEIYIDADIRIIECFYCEVYDCKFDKKGKWLEEKCKGEECTYCIKRPNKHPKDCKCGSKEISHIVRRKRKKGVSYGKRRKILSINKDL